MSALSFSDAQMRLVREAATGVPVEWRSRFLELIADRLIGADAIDDSAVFAAVRDTLESMFGKIGCA